MKKMYISLFVCLVSNLNIWGMDSCGEDLDMLTSVKPATALVVTDSLTVSNSTPKTVITFGTFDLFHMGHLNILRRAKELACGGKLYVGVSSDEFSFRRKQRYPAIKEDERTAIVRACQYVDDVFYETDYNQKPGFADQFSADFLVLGDDWSGKFDNFHPTCKFVALPRTADISTTDLLSQIVRAYPPEDLPALPGQSLQGETLEYVDHHFDKRFPPAMYHVIAEFERIMERYQVPFFFTCGTLLGAARHKGVIPWDEDADAAILDKHVEPFVQKVVPDLLNKGYIVNYINTGWKGFQIRPVSPNNEYLAYIELFTMDFCPETSDYGFSMGWPKVRMREDQVFPIKKMIFGNTVVSVPSDFKYFLNTYYGQDWKTHIKICNHRYHVHGELFEATPKDLMPAGPFVMAEDLPSEPLAITLLTRQKKELDMTGVFGGGMFSLFENLRSTKELEPFPSLEGKTFIYGSASNLFPYRDLTFGADGKVEGCQHSNESTWKVCGNHIFHYHETGYVTNVFYLCKRNASGKLMFVGNFIPDWGLSIHYLIEK